MAEKDSIAVLSGGMDSVTMLHEFKDRIALAVTFDYGSNHNAREAECAARQCGLLGIEHIIIPLDFMENISEARCLRVPTAFRKGIMRIRT